MESVETQSLEKKDLGSLVDLYKDVSFDGQQDGERILYVLRPHWFMLLTGLFKAVLVAALVFVGIEAIKLYAPNVSQWLNLLERGVGIVTGVLILSIYWHFALFLKTITFITDRRVVRFSVVFPLFVVKRALFWAHALKGKADFPNLLFRFVNIATLRVRPEAADEEDVSVPYVTYCEDLVNYIDKILYYSKNEQSSLKTLRPFIAKPKGQRY